MKKIKIGIVGYGNLAKGIESEIANFPDIEIVAIFTRRKTNQVKAKYPIYHISNILKFENKIDIMVLCVGSAVDLPKIAPKILKNFNTVDAYDTHSNIVSYHKKMHQVAAQNNKLATICTGWDPGVFSMLRLCFESFLPNGNTTTFWGKGISQGHSEAIRKIAHVVDARQYTIPKSDAVELVRGGKGQNLNTRDKHLRECFVVSEDEKYNKFIENEIKTMPAYFEDYDTIVNFISLQELNKNHSQMPHGGFVIRQGKTNKSNSALLELNIKLTSNPEFTSSVMLAYVRATYKLFKKGIVGALTPLDIPLSCLCINNKKQTYEKFL